MVETTTTTRTIYHCGQYHWWLLVSRIFLHPCSPVSICIIPMVWLHSILWTDQSQLEWTFWQICRWLCCEPIFEVTIPGAFRMVFLFHTHTLFLHPKSLLERWIFSIFSLETNSQFCIGLTNDLTSAVLFMEIFLPSPTLLYDLRTIQFFSAT